MKQKKREKELAKFQKQQQMELGNYSQVPSITDPKSSKSSQSSQQQNSILLPA